jgi:phosphosulfolactate synthase (CoM biosynthesis protein A)
MMNPTALQLPPRASKPRPNGLTMVIDGGIPLAHFADLVSSAAEYIDFVKFGWGTAVVTAGLQAKIDVLAANEIGFYFGGTLFEKYVLQGRFDDYRKFCDTWSCRHIEVSNGTIMLSNSEKASYIRKLTDDFTVISEVGYKDPGRSEQLPPRIWAEYIAEDLSAGASLVTLEARERVRDLPSGRRAAVRAGRGRARVRPQPGQPAVRGPVYHAAGVLRHQARAGREPRERPGVWRHRTGNPPARAPRRYAGSFRVGDIDANHP